MLTARQPPRALAQAPRADAPAGASGCFVAYTKGLPNRFLAPACVHAFFRGAAAAAAAHAGAEGGAAQGGAGAESAEPGAEPAGAASAATGAGAGGKWLVGEVRRVDGPLVAAESSEEAALLNLLPGAQYWLLTAEPVG